MDIEEEEAVDVDIEDEEAMDVDIEEEEEEAIDMDIVGLEREAETVVAGPTWAWEVFAVSIWG